MVVLFAVSVAAFGILFAASAGPAQAGVAAAVKGQVTALPEGAIEHPLKSGDKIFQGDTIKTGADGRLQVLLLDSTVFTLGPLSAVKMDEFVYDPATDDGKVKASMLKGIFRVVTGKVSHKKPENMEVALPSGTLGFRGTQVAGIIDGQQTMVVLLGPVSAGRISVSNLVNGEVITIDVDERGFGTIVGGPNMAPIPVFQVSEADLARIANALGQQLTGGADMSSTGDGGVGGGSTSPSVNTEELLNILSTIDDLGQQSQQAAQDIATTKVKTDHKDSSNSDGQTGGFIAME